MKALDLFCGEGGAAKGLHDAGFEVMGIDINPMPEYPYTFLQADAMKLDKKFLQQFDFIWASPPCQAYSAGGNVNSRKKYPKLIPGVRKMLEDAGVPFVIENVMGAPLQKDRTIMLCGDMFGLKVIRHRLFEMHGFILQAPKHLKHKGTVSSGAYQGVYTGGRCGCFGNNKVRNKLKVGSIKDWQNAMGITHITTRKGLAESIPPKYSYYIARNFLLQKQFKGD
jgi:hypothetical protein